MIPVSILFEDDSLLVINKPPGVVVNRAVSVQTETIQDWAEQKLGLSAVSDASSDEVRVYADRSGIAHRIDKETSGCLLIAKTPTALTALMAQFKQRTVHKTYLAVVHGILPAVSGEIRAPVGRLPWNRERFGILPGGKDAVTTYAVLGSFPAPHGNRKQKEDLSLVEVYPKTGRTHQIRVHMKYAMHPLVADWQYAGRKTARRDRLWAGRVMLHAWRIRFLHPVIGEELAIEAPIPDDMRMLIPEGIVPENSAAV